MKIKGVESEQNFPRRIKTKLSELFCQHGGMLHTLKGEWTPLSSYMSIYTVRHKNGYPWKNRYNSYNNYRSKQMKFTQKYL